MNAQECRALQKDEKAGRWKGEWCSDDTLKRRQHVGQRGVALLWPAFVYWSILKGGNCPKDRGQHKQGVFLKEDGA